VPADVHEFIATTAAPQPRKLTREEAQQVSFWTMLVALVGLTAVVVLLAIALYRRRTRETALRRDMEARAVQAAQPHVSAWEEAGRRAPIPPPEALGEAAASPATPHPAEQTSIVTGFGPRPIALITGAARRVGRAVALELARCGCDVLFTYNASADDAHALARELASLGIGASFFKLDLDDLGAVEAFAAERAETLARLDVLVHNASTYDPTPIDELTSESVLRQYRVNAAAPLLLSSRLAPLLRQSELPGGGCVIALADIHAMGKPRKGFSAYAMSKAALVEMVHTLARDLAPKVRVNAVAPGVVAWPEEGLESDPDAQLKYLRRIPLGRAGTPDDAAQAVRWLALEATYITGEVIRVDGGRWLT